MARTSFSLGTLTGFDDNRIILSANSLNPTNLEPSEFVYSTIPSFNPGLNIW